MLRPTQISIPALMRVKPGALDRIGINLCRDQRASAAVIVSRNLVQTITDRVAAGFKAKGIDAKSWIEVAARLFAQLPCGAAANIGLGSGKAFDVAKHVSFLARLLYYADPTSLSKDGFCSPQSNLTVAGKRRSLPSAIPYGIVVDTEICRTAPKSLTSSGVGALTAKCTAIFDWKLTFHHVGEQSDDFAAPFSDGAIYSFLGRPSFDDEGIQLLATSLMLNGISMQNCGSYRPASGIEHLISHALDAISARPRRQGLQVGVATYLMCKIQNTNSEQIASLFEKAGFWQLIIDDRFSPKEWAERIRMARSIKPRYFTSLSVKEALPEAMSLLANGPYLQKCIED